MHQCVRECDNMHLLWYTNQIFFKDAVHVLLRNGHLVSMVILNVYVLLFSFAFFARIFIFIAI